METQSGLKRAPPWCLEEQEIELFFRYETMKLEAYAGID